MVLEIQDEHNRATERIVNGHTTHIIANINCYGARKDLVR